MQKTSRFTFPPEDENAKIWHYMTFASAYALVMNSALFFTSADHFEDPREGTLPLPNLDEQLARDQREPPVGDPSAVDLEKAYREEHETRVREQQGVYCWHLADEESEHMWRKFAGPHGVAIQSTYRRLRDSFVPTIFTCTDGQKIDTTPIYIGEVRYIDYDADRIKDDDQYTARYFCKNKESYSHEKELRALVIKHTADDGQQQSPLGYGINIKIDRGILIERIYVRRGWLMPLLDDVLSRWWPDADRTLSEKLVSKIP